MEDPKMCNKDIYIMYADFKGAFHEADHRIMFKHMREFGMPPSFVDTCEQLYRVSTTNYITPNGTTPHIDIKGVHYRGTRCHPSSSPSF
jgi:hypothetical protein